MSSKQSRSLGRLLRVYLAEDEAIDVARDILAALIWGQGRGKMDRYELKDHIMTEAPARKKFRQRKRDWPRTVYKFWSRPLEPLPDQLWHQARQMNQLWNELLELRRMAQSEAAALEGDRKKQRWTRFNDDAKAVVKASPADSTAKRLRVRPVSSGAYSDARRETVRRRLTRGVFGLADDASFEFETIIHRPIPQNAIVKQANWCGVFDRNLRPDRRWAWSIQLVCEVPPERFYVSARDPDPRGVCAIDLGWRVMADGEYLRVGYMLTDAGRAYEFRLPLYMAKKRDLAKKDYYNSFHDLLALDSRIGLAVQRAKERVLLHLGGKPAGYDKMRQRGLRKLMDEASGELKVDLGAWDIEDRKLSSIKAAVTQRMKRRNLTQIDTLRKNQEWGRATLLAHYKCTFATEVAVPCSLQ